ncbi:MAG: aspartate/glutamate racemase family protein [Bacteroidota bacterium]
MNYPIAIMDYGIGGIGLVSMIKNEFPGVPILYFSDSGEVPYGQLSYSTLKSRVEKVIEYLFQKGADRVVVACHAASTVIESDHKLIDIRELTLTSIDHEPAKSIGIIGGGRTIRSRFYQKNLKKRSKQVKQRIAQQLSILIERGEVETAEVDKAAKRILEPIKTYDRLLLACTHYPAIRKKIESIMKAECDIIDPVHTIYHLVKKPLYEYNGSNHGDRFYTTGDAELMKFAALNAFGFEIEVVSKVMLA